MFGTFKEEDVTILLKDISGLVEPQSTEEREKAIQSGRHYCEMLPIEYEPSKAYELAFEDALRRYSGLTARAVASAAQKIWRRKDGDPVIVSLARAGTPIGILIKRYIRLKYGADIPHYTISIIRGKGIDRNAVMHILSKHQAEKIQFVDGWTGKGAIQKELRKAMAEFPEIDPGLAVLSDPAHVAALCGTRDDFLIASSCLNATVSGLLSRTFLRPDIIGEKDYHGAVFYKELMAKDVSYHFIDTIEKEIERLIQEESEKSFPRESEKSFPRESEDPFQKNRQNSETSFLKDSFQKRSETSFPKESFQKRSETSFLKDSFQKRSETSFLKDSGESFPKELSQGESRESKATENPDDDCGEWVNPALREVEDIAAKYGVKDINLIKPGIGEATRVLLRRLPWKVLVHSLDDEEHLGHLYQLAREKGVDISEYPLRNYRACGIIKSLADT